MPSWLTENLIRFFSKLRNLIFLQNKFSPPFRLCWSYVCSKQNLITHFLIGKIPHTSESSPLPFITKKILKQSNQTIKKNLDIFCFHWNSKVGANQRVHNDNQYCTCSITSLLCLSLLDSVSILEKISKYTVLTLLYTPKSVMIIESVSLPNKKNQLS